MAKGISLVLLTALIAPLLLVMALGNAAIEAVHAACVTPTTAGDSGGGSVFRIGTLNWRGASHYTKNPHPGERPYLERVPHMVSKIGASGASIVGFQEFEPPQAHAFLAATGGQWRIVSGRAHGHADTRDALAYQPAAWTLEETMYLSISYGATPVDIPLARFTSTAGLGTIWVLNTHNPADAVGGSAVLRDSAVRAQAAVLSQLHDSDPTTPLFLVGDMNDRARFKRLFLALAGPGWSPANPNDDQIDWILGGPGVTFAATVVDTTTNDHARRYTDHPFVHTLAYLANPTVAYEGSDEAAVSREPSISTHSNTETQKAPEASVASVASVAPPSLTESADGGADEPSSGPSEDSPTRPGETLTTGCPPCPTSSPSVVLTGPGTISVAAQLTARAAYQAGFRGEDLVTAVAVAGVESGWDPVARNGGHFGLWQIAATHRGIVPGWDTPDDILDPLLNATYAYALYVARPGSGEAKFADWLPFEEEDYHHHLDIARRAVLATTADQQPAASPGETGCAAPPMVLIGELRAELAARISSMLATPYGLCALSWTSGAPCTYDNQCPKVVDAIYGGPGVGRGYGNGQDVAQGIINAGLAQSHGSGLDPLPPIGAVVSYNSGDGTGHVAVYVGGGKIFGNDYGCTSNGVYGCVGFADIHAPSGSVTWALPQPAFDLGGMPQTAA